MTMLEGSTPDDHTLVTMVVEAIKRKVPDGVGGNGKGGGWILVDFPRTLGQAVLLERELSG